MLRWGMQVAGSGCKEPYLGYCGRLQKHRLACRWEALSVGRWVGLCLG